MKGNPRGPWGFFARPGRLDGLVSALLCLVAAFLGFQWYGRIRLFHESIGLDVYTVVSTSSLASVFSVSIVIAVAGVAALCFCRVLREDLLLVLPLVICGELVCEAWIVVDEYRFVAQVREMGVDRWGRTRAWPFSHGTLYYSEDSGYSADN